MCTEIHSCEDFLLFIKNERAILCYFSTDTCNVCKVLKQKVEELLETEFPRMRMVYIKSNILSEVAAQNQVFIAPTIIVFFDGKEYIRKSRNIGIRELHREIERPYTMLFHG